MVSILVPVYNCEAYLDECIESLQRQTYQNFEAILVNDGSTDNSLEILRKYAATDKRLKVYTQKNKGLSATRNEALRHVVGDFIFLLDADDFISEDLLESALEKFDINPEIDAVMCQQIQYEDETHQTLYPVKVESEFLTGKQALVKSIDWEIHAQMVFKAELFKDVEYDTTINYGDELTKRIIISNCRKITFCDGKYYYRFNPQSLTKKMSVKFFDYGRSYLKLRNVLKDKGAYSESQDIIELKLLNILKSLDYYFRNHHKKLSYDDKKYAKVAVREMYDALNTPVLKNYFKTNRSRLSYIFFCVKMSSYLSYKIIGALLFPIVGKNYV